MSIEIHESQIPSLITWFNSFVGFREIQKRFERVEAKLEGLGFVSPTLNRRYSFHTTYNQIVIRNRRHQKIDIRQIENHRVLSTLGTIHEISKALSDAGKIRLRSRILDALSPDRDARELEHELRVFVHYKQAGLEVLPFDSDPEQRFDFLVKGPNGEFEVECKTFSESLGSSISAEESTPIFRGVKSAFDSSSSFLPSGIFRLTVPSRNTVTEQEIIRIMLDFFSKGSASIDYGNIIVSFERIDRWDDQLRSGNIDAVTNEIVKQQELTNPHAMIAISRKHAFMFCLSSLRPPRTVQGICARLKEASGQFSKTRPALIWGHFLGISEAEFNQALQKRENRGSSPFDVLGQYVFGSQNRRHVCRLRLSVESDAVRETGYQLFIPYRSGVISAGGPAYDLTSKVSEFDQNSIQ